MQSDTIKSFLTCENVVSSFINLTPPPPSHHLHHHSNYQITRISQQLQRFISDFTPGWEGISLVEQVILRNLSLRLVSSSFAYIRQVES